MANESISSLPVLDNHSNVIGNISQVDVKVCPLPPCSLRSHTILLSPVVPQSSSQQRPNLPPAPHQIDLPPPPQRQLHPLHNRHPQRARRARRQRLLPRLPHLPVQHICAHNSEARSNSLPSHVDHRPGRAAHSSDTYDTCHYYSCSCTRTRISRRWKSDTRAPLHSPRQRSHSRESAGTIHERAANRRDQSDGRVESDCESERAAEFRAGRGEEETQE